MEQWIHNFLEKISDNKDRTKLGMTTSKVGLISNLLLFIIKLIAGTLSGSISIVTDGMNNLGDSASSLLSLFGFRAASKPADKEHPYGHERSEYISGLLIAVIIIFVGFQFLLTSINQIFAPTALETSAIIIILLIISIVAKLIQGRFYQIAANLIDSNTLHSASKDSFNDALITLLVLISTVMEVFSGWQIDGYAGALLSIWIIYNGIHAILESIDDLLGTRPSKEDIKQMKQLLDQYDEIIGYHDLLVHSYGPNQTFATIHIEIDDSWNLKRSHRLIDEIEDEFADKLGVELVCHVDPIAIQSEADTAIYRQVKQILQRMELDLHFHDFKVETIDQVQTILFDVVIPEEVQQSNRELFDHIHKEIIQQIDKDFEVKVKFDRIDLLENI